MTRHHQAGDVVHHHISGGTFFGYVVQGRNVDVRLPPQVVPALAGLPPPSRTFAGRNDDLEALLSHLDPAQSPPGGTVCAVSGLPGVGKTELVLQVAARALAEEGWFPGGVLFHDLLGYHDGRQVPPERVLHHFLHALGISPDTIPDGLQERSGLYRSVLANYAERGRRILVVIDNASATHQVGPLLPGDGATAVLVTSRHRLSDLGARLHDLKVLSADASLALLRKALSHTRGSTDTRVDDEAAEAKKIAELCGYLPLALQIVAALLADEPERGLTAMVEDLTDTRSRLDELERDDVGVRAAFDLSFRHLPQEQADIFRLLHLIPGPHVSTGAAAALAGVDGRTARRRLEGLGRAHLIESVGDRLWRMHDLVRLYAAGLGPGPEAHAESSDAFDRLLSYYFHTAEAAMEALGVAGDDASRSRTSRQDALERVDREYANLIAAATGTATEDHPVFRMCLSLILSPFLARRRLLDDWLATAESGLDASREVGDPHMEAGASINLAGALIGCRQYRRAADVYQQSASAYRKIGHKDGEGAALSGVGASLIAMAEFEDALPILRRAVAVLRRSGDRQEFGTALISLGRAWAGVGEFDVAVDTAQQAVDTLREAGDRHAEGEALFALGKVLHEAGRGERSVDVLRQAVTAFQETDDAQMEEVARNYIDLVHVEGAQEGGVSDAFLTTFTAGIEIGDANSTAGDTLMLRGAVLLKAGRVGQAAEFLREAVSVFRETGPRLNEGDASALLGVSLMVANEWRDTEAAMAALESAIVIYQELGEVQRASLAHGCVRLIHGARHMEKREWDEAFDVLLDVLDRRTSSGRKPGRAWRRLFRSRKK